MIKWLGAGAWVTPSVQDRQAYFGRTVTMTRNCAALHEYGTAKSIYN